MWKELLVIIALIIFVGVLTLVFKFIDGYIKRTPKKVTEKTETAQPEEKQEKVEEAPAKPEQNLADEIIKSISGQPENKSNRIRAYDRIKRYHESRKYKEFELDIDDEDEPNVSSTSVKLSPDEYKKIVVLGHLDNPQ
jgi:flagellar biosynthesis/type III secretory pathway M-ring protein FliF/YscJ